MKQIILTQGKITFVDDEDYLFLNQWKWQAQKGARTYYARRTDYTNRGKVSVTMHRLLLEGKFIDHRDGDGLNNQRNNLRSCTRAENNRNKKASGFCKYLGVTLKKQTNRWVARIMADRKAIHLGYFPNADLAAAAYDNAAIYHFGEFANLNNKMISS